MDRGGGMSGPFRLLGSFLQPALLLGIIWCYHYFIFSDMNTRILQLEDKWVAEVANNQVTGLSTNKFINMKAPPNMPSILVAEDSTRKNSSDQIYGGTIDKPHLGGFLVDKIDYAGYSPALWNFMIGPIAVKSVVDVGCGVGYSLKYFHDRGARSLCVEGSHHAVLNSKLPSNIIVEHDFTRGPWWPTETYDAAWSVEFLEHVGRQHMENYMPIFQKSALIFATSSMWGKQIFLLLD
jgi:2-polyprenyl-3-methyl-5-hydroxy-6-metoxy-1,4-benzoquinol methylase